MSLDFMLFVFEAIGIDGTIRGEDKGVFLLDVGFLSNRADGSVPLGHETGESKYGSECAAAGGEEEKVRRGSRSVRHSLCRSESTPR